MLALTGGSIMRRSIVLTILVVGGLAATPALAHLSHARATQMVRAAQMHRALAPSLMTQAQTDPAVAAAILTTPGGVTGSETSGAGTNAVMAATCWGSIWSRWTWTAFTGDAIGNIQKDQEGWCGDGQQITRDFGWNHSTWSWGPYCITNVANRQGWDHYPSWKHGAVYGSIGVSYPWGCGSVHSGNAALRIKSAGGWDAVNDF